LSSTVDAVAEHSYALYSLQQHLAARALVRLW
jgi:hypothetical protein